MVSACSFLWDYVCLHESSSLLFPAPAPTGLLSYIKSVVVVGIKLKIKDSQTIVALFAC